MSRRLGVFLGVVFSTLVLMFGSLLADYLLEENFEDSWLPPGWTKLALGNTDISGDPDTLDDWHLGPTTTTSPFVPAAHGNFAEILYSDPLLYPPADSCNDWLITPTLDCSFYDTVIVSFWHFFNTYTAGTHLAYVLLSTDDGVSWSETLFTFTDVDSAYCTRDVSDKAAHESHVKFAFLYRSYDDFWWIVDSVYVYGGGASEPAPPVISHTPLDDQPDGMSGYGVGATITDFSGVDPTSVYVYYNAGSGWTSLPMSETAVPDSYFVTIPPQPVWTEVCYYITATDLFSPPNTAYSDTFCFVIYGPYFAYDDEDDGEFVPDTDWVEIAGVGTFIDWDLYGWGSWDDNHAPVELPFPFRFYGRDYDTVWVSTNGWISFGEDPGDDFYANYELSDPSAPDFMFAPLWDDFAFYDPLWCPTAGSVYVYNDISHHRFVIEWNNAEDWATGDLSTFEVILIDPAYPSAPVPGDNGELIVKYKTISSGVLTSSTVGVRRDDAEYTQYVYNGTYDTDADGLEDQSAVEFVPVEPHHAVIAGNVNLVGRTDNGGAEVLVVELGRTTHSASPSGDYSISVPPGSYTVVASCPGFYPDTAYGVSVALDDTAFVNFVLEPMPIGYIQGLADLSDTGPYGDPWIAIDIGGTHDTLLYTTTGGVYLAGPLESGIYSIVASYPGYGVEVVYDVEVVSNETTYVADIILDPQTPDWTEDFDTDDGGFVVGEDAFWEWGTPSGTGPAAAHSTPYCWGTVIGGDYGMNNASWQLFVHLDRPYAYISFWHWYDMENYLTTGYDGGNIWVSTDNGDNWWLHFPEGGYPTVISTSFGNVLGGLPAYSGSSSGWEQVWLDLSAYEGDATDIMFWFASDGSINDYPGWYLDDFEGYSWPTGAVKGYVVDIETHEPIYNARVRCGPGVTYSNTGGEFFLDNIPAGAKQIVGTKMGYFPGFVSANVYEGDTTEVIIRMTPLHLTPSDHITGEVTYGTVDSVPVTICNPTDQPIEIYVSPEAIMPFTKSLSFDDGISASRVAPESAIDIMDVKKGIVPSSFDGASADRSLSRTLATGDIVDSFRVDPLAGIVTDWGIGIQNDNYYWITDMATNRFFKFSTADGSFTGEVAYAYWLPDTAIALNNQRVGDYLWNTSIAATGLFAWDPVSHMMVDSLTDPAHIWDQMGEFGIAYDPVEDVFYLGSSDHFMYGGVLLGTPIYKVRGKSWPNPGTIIDSLNYFYTGGLAFHPGRRTIWVAELGMDICYEMDFENKRIISSFTLPGDASGLFSTGGLDIDSEGRFWFHSRVTHYVYIIDSGHATLPNGLSVYPPAGVIPPGECYTFYIIYDGSLDLIPGTYEFPIYIFLDDDESPNPFVATIQVNPALHKDWNLISVPVEAEPNNVSMQLRDDISPWYADPWRSLIYKYDSEDREFVVPTSFDIGTGYFLWSWFDDSHFDVSGEPFTRDTTFVLPYTEASTGWYMMGNPYSKLVDWHAVCSDPEFSGIGTSYYVWLGDQFGFYYYNPATGIGFGVPAGMVDRMLDPWVGFWVQVLDTDEGGTLPFRYEPLPPAKATGTRLFKRTVVVDSIGIEIVASRAGMEDPCVMATSAGASDGFDPSDMLHIPAGFIPSGQTFISYFVASDSALAVDNKAPLETSVPKVWSFHIEAYGDVTSLGTMTISWPADGELFVPTEGYSVVLHDLSTGADVNMVEEPSYTFHESGDTRDFEIVVTRIAADVEQLAIPTTYALSQNYPNPFNAATAVNYALPENTDVVLEIYNLLGQKVVTLVDENQEAGYYSIIWDGMDDDGVPVPTGVYLYKLRAGNFVETKKMVLLK